MKIKICGITRKEEAEWLNDCDVELAGFVLFFPKSRRCLSLEEAVQIMEVLHPRIQKVAVVVSPSLEQVKKIENAGFDYIQIHGTLPQEILSRIRIPVLKAFNVTDIEQLEEVRGNDVIAGYVFDAQEPGSGRSFDWSTLASVPEDGKMRILAGGLHPGNVAQAIATVKPEGVDVSSGVERDDGMGKDLEKIRAFVRAAREAWQTVETAGQSG